MLTRPLGWPKSKWKDDIINDMKKLKINNWTSYIQDRNEWKLYINYNYTYIHRLHTYIHISLYLCCSDVIICVVRMLLFVLFECYLCCSMYCLYVNVYCHRVKTQLQLINKYIYRFVDCLLAGTRWNLVPASKQSTNLYDICPKLYVQSWTPDDGRKDRPKHVEWYSINSKNCASSWFYSRNISRCTVPWTSNLLAVDCVEICLSPLLHTSMSWGLDTLK
jgi:hypothetical protein